MSLRASHAVQNWLHRRVLSVPSHPHPTIPPAQQFLALAHVNNGNVNGDLSTKRHLSGTNTRHARPSPSVRRNRREQLAGEFGTAYLDPDGVTPYGLSGDLDGLLDHFNRNAQDLYQFAQWAAVLPGELRFRTFKSVGNELIRTAFLRRPEKGILLSISQDVDTVFKIGYVVSRISPPFIEWVLSSCALDGSRTAIVLLTARNIKRRNKPRRSVFTDQVAALAKEGYPPAMLLEANIREKREQFSSALSLLDTMVVPHLRTMPRKPPIWKDITFNGAIEAPWPLYLRLKSRAEHHKDVRRLLEIGAKDFQDPQSLYDYAKALLINNHEPPEKNSEKNLETYEECMSKAAAAGHVPAAVCLATHYILISLNESSKRNKEEEREREKEEKKGKEEKKKNEKNDSRADNSAISQEGSSDNSAPKRGLIEWIKANLSNPEREKTRSQEREAYYRRLAIDWYDLAFNQNSAAAGYMLAVLFREDGRINDGLSALALAERHSQFRTVANELRGNYHKTLDDYEASIPVKLLQREAGIL